jgi:hypothetical protein
MKKHDNRLEICRRQLLAGEPVARAINPRKDQRRSTARVSRRCIRSKFEQNFLLHHSKSPLSA